MPPRPENQFPTIRDLHARMAELIERGLGEHPVQVLVVPDATLQPIAIDVELPGDRKPAAMIELYDKESADRLPVSLVCAERLSGGGKMPSIQTQ